MKNILPLVLIFASFYLGAAPIDAQTEHPIDISFEQCLSLDKNMTTRGMAGCATEAEKQWDIELNRVYAALMSKLDKPAKEKLKAAQRAWITYKELEVENMYSIYQYIHESGNGGTILIPMQAMDKLEITKTRTLELDGYLSIIEP